MSPDPGLNADLNAGQDLFISNHSFYKLKFYAVSSFYLMSNADKMPIIEQNKRVFGTLN